MGIVPAPRQGATGIECAEQAGIDNPDCTLCPRKWARGQKGGAQAAATALLRSGIRLGQGPQNRFRAVSGCEILMTGALCTRPNAFQIRGMDTKHTP